jgi:steroid delta-isomerase-like uncharacterized protein
MTIEENKALVRRWYDEVLNRRNLAVADEILAEDFVINGRPIGRDGLKQAVRWVRSIFPDTIVTIEDVIAEGDRVVTRWCANATHQGEFQGIPATGKAITLRGIHIDRVANGKIAERWEEVDLPAVLQQIKA